MRTVNKVCRSKCPVRHQAETDKGYYGNPAWHAMTAPKYHRALMNSIKSLYKVKGLEEELSRDEFW